MTLANTRLAVPLTLFPLLIGGCALEADDTATTEQDIVGGGAVNSRPEIGEVRIGGGCLSPAYWATTVPAGSTSTTSSAYSHAPTSTRSTRTW